MKIITRLDDLPAWDEGSEFPESSGDIFVDWLDHGSVEVDVAEVEYDSDGNEVDHQSLDLSILRDNYNALRDRWRGFIVEAITEIEGLITENGQQDSDFSADGACFTVRLPIEPIGEDSEWSFELEEEHERLWMLDYRGWRIVDRVVDLALE